MLNVGDLQKSYLKMELILKINYLWMYPLTWELSITYHPQSNGRIEVFYNVLKACTSKHVSKSLEWDQVVPIASALYNFFPKQTLEAKNLIVPLNSLLKPTVRYLCMDENILPLGTLKNMYQLVVTNLELTMKSEIPKDMYQTGN